MVIQSIEVKIIVFLEIGTILEDQMAIMLKDKEPSESNPIITIFLEIVTSHSDPIITKLMGITIMLFAPITIMFWENKLL